MKTGRTAEIRNGMMRRRVLAPAAAMVAAGVALLAGSALFFARAQDRFERLRTDHRRWSQTVREAREERGKEGAIHRAVSAVEARAADERDLRSVFDPIVAPGKGSGVETKSVSYKVVGTQEVFKLYEIRFSAAGKYPDLGRFLSRIEAGLPGFVVEGVAMKKGDRESVSAEVTLRVPVR